MIRFEDLLEKVRAYSPDADVELLRRAYVFSAFEHRGQVRHSGEPYLIHPLAVADFLADMKLDAVAIAAGLLHDVVEDTLTTIERIQELFGPEVAHVVEGVTKISAIRFSSSEERQAENFRKMLLAMVDDIRVILVKLADRLHNMRTLSHLPEERRVPIAQETRDIYAPIANRLGHEQGQERARGAVVPLPRAAGLRGAARPGRRQAPRDRRADRAAEDDDRDQAARARRCRSIEIDGRIKRLWSISQKLKRQRIELEQVYDFIALRIITQQREGLLRRARHHPPDLVAGAGPDQGLHRDAAAQRLPVAAHLGDQRARHAVRGADPHHRNAPDGGGRDRRALEVQGGARRRSARTSATSSGCGSCSTYQQEVRDPQEFIQNLKVELYPEEVYTFTPKGQVKAFPRGATPIDFAYSIHTDVGHQCVGARVNGKMVPLRARLKNGDIVEIVTQAGHKPSRDWLNFVVTSHARYKIKHLIRLEERARAIELGRKVFEKEAAPLRPDRQERSRTARRSPRRWPTSASEDAGRSLRARSATARCRPKQLLGKLVPAERLREKPPEGAVAAAVRRVFGARRGEDQGPRLRRRAGVPGAVLQSDPRREDRRLHHARQGRLGPLGDVSERRQPALRPRAPHRGRVGQGRRRRRPATP